MTAVSTNPVQYELNSLSEDAKAQFASLKFVDQKVSLIKW